eukprot:sb/3472417/
MVGSWELLGANHSSPNRSIMYLFRGLTCTNGSWTNRISHDPVPLIQPTSYPRQPPHLQCSRRHHRKRVQRNNNKQSFVYTATVFRDWYRRHLTLCLEGSLGLTPTKLISNLLSHVALTPGHPSPPTHTTDHNTDVRLSSPVGHEITPPRERPGGREHVYAILGVTS